jgi:transcription elongation factor Elf1
MTHGGRHNKCPTCGNRLSVGTQNTDTETITIKACSRCGWSNKPRTPEELQKIKTAREAKRVAMSDKPEVPKGAKGTPEWKKKKLEKERKKKAKEAEAARIRRMLAYNPNNLEYGKVETK